MTSFTIPALCARPHALRSVSSSGMTFCTPCCSSFPTTYSTSCSLLNMFTSEQLVEYVVGKLEQHGVQKVIPDDDTLRKAWGRAHNAGMVNEVIDAVYNGGDSEVTMPTIA